MSTRIALNPRHLMPFGAVAVAGTETPYHRRRS